MLHSAFLTKTHETHETESNVFVPCKALLNA